MQNWNQWQLSTGTSGSMPQPPAGGYPASGGDPMATMQAYMQYYNQPAPSGYTAEQWTAAQQQNWTQWQQWQQQYHQWQAQYGAKYQESLKQISGSGGSSSLPGLQPPPLPKDDVAAKPPLPPDNSGYNYSTGSNMPHLNNLPLFPSKNSGNPPLPPGQPPPPPDNPPLSDGLLSGTKRSASTDILTESAKKLKKEDEELTEAEKTFDAQFKLWEAKGNKWKQENANHPDKALYKQYEAKWTAWREKLIEQREQLRKKREAHKLKAEAERKKNMPGGDKILNILSSTENQGLLNNLLGIGKTLGLTGKEATGGQPIQSTTSSGSGMGTMDTQQPIAGIPSTMTSDMNQQAWAAQQWSAQYNMNNMPMQGFSSFPQPPPLMSLNQSSMNSNLPPFNQPHNVVNPDANFSQPPPGFPVNPQNNQSNNPRDQNMLGRHDDGPGNRSFNRDSYDQDQQNRFNDRGGPNDKFRGNESFDRDGPRGMNSGGFNQGPNDNRGDFPNDSFHKEGGPRNFGSDGKNDFRPDSFAPRDRFGDRGKDDRFGNDQRARDQDRFGSNRGPFDSSFDRGSNDRFGSIASDDRFGGGHNRFHDDNDRFGSGRSMSGDRFGTGASDRGISGDRFGSGSNRFGSNMNRFDSADSTDRNDSFGPNSRNPKGNDRFNAAPEIPAELKALMEKRRAAQNVFKPSGTFLGSEKSTTSFGSLSESFRKITGDSPFLPKDRPGDHGRMSPIHSLSRSSLLGSGPNSGFGGPSTGGFGGSSGFGEGSGGKFIGESNRGFGGGQSSGFASGMDNRFREDNRSRDMDSFPSRNSRDFDARDMGPRPGDFGARGMPPGNAPQQKIPPLEMPPWIDPNMMRSPMGPTGDNKDSNKSSNEHSNTANLPEKNDSFRHTNEPPVIPEPLLKKPDTLPFMGENDPKPEDLNMEPPPELPDLGPVKQPPQVTNDRPFDSKSSENSFERSSDFFNRPSFPSSSPFGNRGPGGPSGGLQGPHGPLRGPNEPSFGMRDDPNFGARGMNDGPFGLRSNIGPFRPGGGMDDNFRKNMDDFGPRGPHMPFGPRENEDFGQHNRNMPFGPRESGDFGGPAANAPFAPRDLDNFGPRGPNQPFGPRDRGDIGPRDSFAPRDDAGPGGLNRSQFGPRPLDDFGPRGPDLPFNSRDNDNFGPRGPNSLFGARENDNFGPRGPNMGFGPRNIDNFGPRCPDNFPPRPNDNFAPPMSGSIPPRMSMNMDMPMNQPKGDMGSFDRERQIDRFREDIRPFDQKPMDDLRPPMQETPRDSDRRPTFPRPDIDRDLKDPIASRKEDGPFARPDDIPAKPRIPFGPMQKSVDEQPSKVFDESSDDPRDPFSRRLDQSQPGSRRDGPIRDFCIQKQFNYNHGGGAPNEMFDDYVPSKVIDYGHIRRPSTQDYHPPAQCFDYSHGKFKPRVPDHEIYPKMDFKHWLENEHNLREYDEGLKIYESQKRYERMAEMRMEERRRFDEQRVFESDRYPPWDKLDASRKLSSSNYRDYMDYGEYTEHRNFREKRARERSWDRDIERHREERARRSVSRDRTREKNERKRKDDSEFSKDDERSKGNVSREEITSKTHADSSSKNSSQTVKNESNPPKTLELGKTPNYTMVDDLLCAPGRQNRPPKIAIILRGPPGSGKSFVAKLIKDKELEQGGSAPRILSLDDYFLVEKDVETHDDNGRRITNKEMVYEYEEAMESSYITSLVKAFKKNITDGFFNFIILDAINEKISDYEDMWSFAKTKGFKVYVCEMEMDVAVCLKRNIHKRTEDEVNRIVDYFEPTPSYHQKLDVSSLLQEDSIQEVQMEEAEASTTKKPDGGNDDSQDSQDDKPDSVGVSKWEKMEAEDKLDRLDGLKRKNEGRPQTMEDFLQVPDYYNMEDDSGKKRVRWADLEERKEQEKMRAVGFVVGHTNWDRMMDPTKGGSALTRTKFFKLK